MTSRVKSSWTILCGRHNMHRLHPSQSAHKQKVAAGGGGGNRGPAAATNVNGSGRQTNSSFSKFRSFRSDLRWEVCQESRSESELRAEVGRRWSAAVKVGIGELVRRVGG